MATQTDVLRTLAAMHETGIKSFRANMLAERLWPNQRHSNANGQVFALGAGVAGRMLKRCEAVFEVRNREWVIIPHRLSETDQVGEPCAGTEVYAPSSGGRAPLEVD